MLNIDLLKNLLSLQDLAKAGVRNLGEYVQTQASDYISPYQDTLTGHLGERGAWQNQEETSEPEITYNDTSAYDQFASDVANYNNSLLDARNYQAYTGPAYTRDIGLRSDVYSPSAAPNSQFDYQANHSTNIPEVARALGLGNLANSTANPTTVSRPEYQKTASYDISTAPLPGDVPTYDRSHFEPVPEYSPYSVSQPVAPENVTYGEPAPEIGTPEYDQWETLKNVYEGQADPNYGSSGLGGVLTALSGDENGEFTQPIDARHVVSEHGLDWFDLPSQAGQQELYYQVTPSGDFYKYEGYPAPLYNPSLLIGNFAGISPSSINSDSLQNAVDWLGTQTATLQSSPLYPYQQDLSAWQADNAAHDAAYQAEVDRITKGPFSAYSPKVAQNLDKGIKSAQHQLRGTVLGDSNARDMSYAKRNVNTARELKQDVFDYARDYATQVTSDVDAYREAMENYSQLLSAQGDTTRSQTVDESDVSSRRTYDQAAEDTRGQLGAAVGAMFYDPLARAFRRGGKGAGSAHATASQVDNLLFGAGVVNPAGSRPASDYDPITLTPELTLPELPDFQMTELQDYTPNVDTRWLEKQRRAKKIEALSPGRK